MKKSTSENNIYFGLESAWWYDQPWKFDKKNNFKYSPDCFYIIVHPTFYCYPHQFSFCYFPFIHENTPLKINQANEYIR